LAGKTEVDAAEYRLTLARLISSGGRDPLMVRVLNGERQQLNARLRARFDSTDALLRNAVADSKNDVGNRLVFANVQGRFQVMRAKMEPLQAIVAQIFEAYLAGRAEDGLALARGNGRFDGAALDDLDSVRTDLNALAQSAVMQTADIGRTARLLTILLFVVSALVGLVAAYVLAARIVRQLRQLVSNTRALQDGLVMEPIHVASVDEVGQLTHAFNHMVMELRAKEQIRDTFGKFVDPKVVAQLLGGGGSNAAERRNVTIFFSDIKGFSSLSEQLTPAVIVRLLNRHFTLSSEAIQAHDGIIDKYIGDAVMAYWAPPFVSDDLHPVKACLAALAQREALVTLRSELSDLIGLRRDVPDLVVRMGIATGEVVLGTIGSETAMSYTVIGDTVNLASRFEGLNKAYGTTIMISEDTYRFARTAVEAREIDLVAVVGKAEPSRVFELLAPAGQLTVMQQQLVDTYAEGLALYRERRYDAADRCFQRCLEIDPADGPSLVMRARSAQFRNQPPGDGWDGVWRAQEK
jgi:adenylate cyclase